MKADEQARATAILASLSADASSAPASPEELVPPVYADPRRLAGRYLSRERPGHTLLPTALFAGLTVKKVAHVLGASTTTVEDDWTHARAWLKEELSPGGGQ